MAQQDLTALLSEWPYEPGQISVRELTGADGRAKLQVRVQLGVLQMEAEGRPDGVRPGGFESLVDLHLDRLKQAEAADRRLGRPRNFSLSAEECAELRAEASQYYHRYVALFSLERYAEVVRDTSRNLTAFDLCRRYAETEHDREVLEHLRPSVLVLRARAEASQCVRSGHSRAAIAAIDRGIQEVRTAYAARGQSDLFDGSGEATALRSLREMLVPKLPSSQRIELEERLRAAIAAENYELAAILRDELRQME